MHSGNRKQPHVGTTRTRGRPPGRRSRDIWRVLLQAAVLVCVPLTLPSCGKLDRPRPPPSPERGVPEARKQIADIDPDKAPEELAESVHADIDCAECHGDPPEDAPEDEVGTAQCVGCHEQAVAAYEETIHAEINEDAPDDDEKAAHCYDCHGAHDTLPASDPDSRVHPRRVPATCGTCHANPELAEELGIEKPKAGELYYESIHGRGLVTQGLLVAPSCVDCHGRAHHIFEADNPKSTVNPANIMDTCGQCHSGPRQSYFAGTHGEALEEGTTIEGEDEEHGAPTCQNCHTAHEIAPVADEFRLASDKICGECHDDKWDRYLETYHGRAHYLGDVGVASCFDCHGTHDILPSDDPASTLSEQNRADTCRKCHEGAPEKFAGYLAHADHSDREGQPGLYWVFIAMTALLLGTFGFFGVHSLMWLGRILVERARDPEGFKEAKKQARAEKTQRLYTRFRPVDRFVHFLVIVSFFLLVITGMPIKFYDAAWAKVFFSIIGGPVVAASVHRFAAVITLSYFILHIGSMVRLLRRNRALYLDDNGKVSTRRMLRVMFGPDSPLPRWQDVKDIIANMKWFLGMGPRPKFDRFTYWEKFDYMAVFWGVTMIGISGLVLWFPAAFTHVLPGWAINIAHIIHSDEALLAAGFIFVFHFFNSHLRPDKWPMDPVMFSGKVTEAELKHERPAQYERLKAEGRLEEEESHLGDWPRWKVFTNPFGGFAIMLGLALAAAIFYALAT